MARISKQKAFELSSVCLHHNLTSYNLDLLAHVNDFLEHHKESCKKTDTSIVTSWKTYRGSTSALLKRYGGGNCAILSEAIGQDERLGEQGLLVFGDMPMAFRVPHVARPGHVAIALPFLDDAQSGWFLMESGFNFPTPICSQQGLSESFVHPAFGPVETSSDTSSGDLLVRMVALSDTSVPDAHFRFSFERATTYDEKLTKPAIGLQLTPRIISRNVRGNIEAMIVVNREKEQVKCSLLGKSAPAISFSEVFSQGWTSCLPWRMTDFAKALRVDPDDLLQRIQDVVNSCDLLNVLADHLRSDVAPNR